MQSIRIRLAHELHDGVLQSLTGAILELESLSRLIDDDPSAARQCLRGIEGLISDEQRRLRRWIVCQRLAGARPAQRKADSSARIAAVLRALCRRVERQWKFRIDLKVAGGGCVPGSVADQIYRLVQEALTNIARHAHASAASASIAIATDRVRIVVADDGRGFPFRGRHDLAALNARRIGPVSLKHRIESLGGSLVVTSSPSGSRLEIGLPLAGPLST